MALAYDIILKLNAPVAQLDRVTGYEPVGRGFESLLAHQQGRAPAPISRFTLCKACFFSAAIIM